MYQSELPERFREQADQYRRRALGTTSDRAERLLAMAMAFEQAATLAERAIPDPVKREVVT